MSRLLKRSNAEYFYFMADDERIKREFVIYSSNFNGCLWPKESMIFFKSSGSSNIGSDWLSNTYFPTTGLSCKVELASTSLSTQYMYNDFNDHTGIDKYHIHGHITKLSDYTTFIKQLKVSGHYNPYYAFKQIVDFYKFIIDECFNLFYNSKLINENKYLILEKYNNVEHFYKLLKTIINYFSCEEQLKISYSLSDNNEGLWSWDFCGVTFIDLCKKRWGQLPDKIIKNKSEEITKETLNVQEAYDYLISKDANINFQVFFKYLEDNNLLLKEHSIGDFMRKNNELVVGNKYISILMSLVKLPPKPPSSAKLQELSIKKSSSPAKLQEISMKKSSSNSKTDRTNKPITPRQRVQRKTLKKIEIKPKVSEYKLEESKKERERLISTRRTTRVSNKPKTTRESVKRYRGGYRKNKKQRKTKKNNKNYNKKK